MSADQDALPTSLPQDVASCHAMLEGVLQTLTEKAQRIHELEELVATLIRERYGRKSERYDPNQFVIFSPEVDDDSPSTEPPESGHSAVGGV